MSGIGAMLGCTDATPLVDHRRCPGRTTPVFLLGSRVAELRRRDPTVGTSDRHDCVGS